jgi:transposase
MYAAGLEAADIARALALHVNTLYSDLQGFDRDGLDWIHQRLPGGAPARIANAQRAEILRLADTLPVEGSLPYARWSFSTLRHYLLERGAPERGELLFRALSSR